MKSQKKRGQVSPPPFQEQDSRLSNSCRLLSLLCATRQDPTFQKHDAHCDHGWINIRLFWNRGLEDGVIERRNRHLSSDITIVTIPYEEYGRDIFAHLEISVFIIVGFPWTADHHSPPTILPLRLQHFHLFSIVVSIFKVLVPSLTREGTDGPVGFPLDDVDRIFLIAPEITWLLRRRKFLPLDREFNCECIIVHVVLHLIRGD